MKTAFKRLLNRWIAGNQLPQQGVSRWVVVDVETSGLNAQKDRLLAIAALGLRVDASARRIDILPGDSFEVVLQQDTVSDRDNVLLHGIGQQQQRDGVPPASAMQAFAEFVADSPLLGFHSAFDQTMIDRWSRQWLAKKLDNPWVDIADLCAVTHQEVKAKALDDWMAHFDLHCMARHQAAADTMVTAELLLRIWPRIAPQGVGWHQLERMSAHRHWLPTS